MKNYNYQTLTNFLRLKNIILLRIFSVFFKLNDTNLNSLNECSLICEFNISIKKYLYIKFKTKAKIISFFEEKKDKNFDLEILIKYILSDKLIFDNSFNLKNFRKYSDFLPEFFIINKKNKNIRLENIQNSQIIFI